MNWYTLHKGQQSEVLDKSVLDILKENIILIEQKDKSISEPIKYLMKNYPQALERLVFEPSDVSGEYDVVDKFEPDPYRRMKSKSTRSLLYDSIISALRLYHLVAANSEKNIKTN